MRIRQETTKDYEEVYKMVQQSFATTSYSDGTEADYLNNVRNRKEFIPELSLVAINNQGIIIGQIVLYETIISTSHGEIIQLVLSPLSVHPNYFNQGIATLLINEALTIAKNMNYKAVFLCGDPTFYSKYGFLPTHLSNIFHTKDSKKNAPWSMVKELEEGFLQDIQGTISID